MTIQRILGNKRAAVSAVPRLFGARVFSSDAFKRDDYQYLQKGQIPMLYFQRSLPRLKIPALNETCDRFLAAAKPILAEPAEFEGLAKMVDAFQTTGSGPQLQKFLQSYDAANKHTSYISKPWFDMYLSDRRPLPLNYNPALIMKLDSRPEYNDQLTRTTNLVVSSLRFMRSLREQQLEPEVFHMNPQKSDTDRYRWVMNRSPSMIATFVSYAFKAFPLDMSQYQGLFGATRVPHKGKDSIKKTEKTTHICVLRNGHFYAVNVIDSQGNILSPQQIGNRLKYIFDDAASERAAEFPLGVLTAENRDVWAGVREHLVQTNNEQALETIDSALFCLALDDKADYSADDPVPIVQNMLHGDKDGLINRWYDKSFTLIVAKDGNAGINFEHSWGDGVAVLRYFNEVYKETTTAPFFHPADVQHLSAADAADDVHKISFHLDDQSKAAIKQALANHTKVVDSLGMHTMINNEMTRGFCKKHKLYPDSVLQLGIQLAYFKQRGQFVGTYESCSTAAFRHGRTETIRPCTMATKAFCETVSTKQNTRDNAALRKMMADCSQAQIKLKTDAAMGRGFDRHMFGLKFMAEQNKIPVDPIYSSDAYKRLNHIILSTSSLAADSLLAGSFGPVVANGYGIGYGVQDKMLGIIFTNYKGQSNGPEFVDCLTEAFGDIYDILEK